MLKLESKKLSVNFGGRIFALSYPTVGMLEKMNKAMNSDSTKSEFEHMKDFMVECGLDVETFDMLEPAHVNEIIEHLTGQKKA